MSGELVSLIGPPGSGKTTVAAWLAKSLDARGVLEDYTGNPFLAESYAGRTDLRLAGQVWFLLSRVNQLARAHWAGGTRGVSDYAFAQDAVYARIWLEGPQWDAYCRLADQVAPLVQPPTVLICLDGPVDLLSRRIAARGREYEQYFTPEFIERLKTDYDDVAASTDCAVIRVDISQRDLNEPSSRHWLLAQATATLAGVGRPE